jgi:hypothetical protein
MTSGVAPQQFIAERLTMPHAIAGALDMLHGREVFETALRSG